MLSVRSWSLFKMIKCYYTGDLLQRKVGDIFGRFMPSRIQRIACHWHLTSWRGSRWRTMRRICKGSQHGNTKIICLGLLQNTQQNTHTIYTSSFHLLIPKTITLSFPPSQQYTKGPCRINVLAPCPVRWRLVGSIQIMDTTHGWLTVAHDQGLHPWTRDTRVLLQTSHKMQALGRWPSNIITIGRWQYHIE